MLQGELPSSASTKEGRQTTKPDQISSDDVLNLWFCHLAAALTPARAEQAHQPGEAAVALAVARPTLQTNFKHSALFSREKILKLVFFEVKLPAPAEGSRLHTVLMQRDRRPF